MKGRAKDDQCEDSQVDSANCCTPLVRNSTSTHSIQGTRRSQQSLKDSKQKGIKLTCRPKSTHAISELKLLIKKSEPLRLGQKSTRKQQENSPLPQNSELMSASKKSILAHKCIDYKNKKIQEHNKEETDLSPHHLQISAKEQELYSTRKQTARTLKYSQDYSESHQFFNIVRAEQSMKVSRDEKNHGCKQRKLIISTYQKECKKTLERVFEETQGRRIVTLESQMSNDEHSNDYSIAEHFEFHKNQL